MVTITLIAGEASGDALGAKLMRALKAQSATPLTFHGVGGPQMQAEGMTSLFPMEELSLLGFLEILPHIPHLLNRIRQTAHSIRATQPDVIVTIDAPAFTNRVVKQLQDIRTPKVHYVAPSVWAYKPQRAKKIAAIYDHLLCLLPFEPPYFEREGLASTFIGHPIVENTLKGTKDGFYAAYDIPKEQPIVLLTPGSRSGELQRLLPVYEETLRRVQQALGVFQPVMLATPRFAARLHQETAHWNLPPIIISEPQQKADAMAAATVALAKSGTGTLELAMAGVPMVVAYKVHPLSAWLLRRMILVDYVTLINLLNKKEIVPEYLQEDCTPEKLSTALIELLKDEKKQIIQQDGYAQALASLGVGQTRTPSDIAAETILGLIKNRGD